MSNSSKGTFSVTSNCRMVKIRSEVLNRKPSVMPTIKHYIYSIWFSYLKEYQCIFSMIIYRGSLKYAILVKKNTVYLKSAHIKVYVIFCWVILESKLRIWRFVNYQYFYQKTVHTRLELCQNNSKKNFLLNRILQG